MPDIANHASGYYEVGGRIFVNKAEALAQASKIQAWPKYHYFNDVWKKQNWTNPACTPIYQLYRQRARQLREKYDYVCLSFSGGSDSTTALQAFVDSGSPIDEIMVRWPIQATENLSVSDSRHPTNYISEWALTIQPMLKKYQQQFGDRTKITVLDWSQDVIENHCSDQVVWELNGSDRLNPSMIKHTTPSPTTMAAIESGLNTCIIFARDKPEIVHRQGRIYCRFLDKFINGHIYSPWCKYIELFYYTPDMPEIVPAQAQILFNHLRANPHLIPLIDLDMKNDPEKFKLERVNQVWNETTKWLIYPDYMRQGWFQALKPTSMINDEIDHWMTQHSMTSRFMDSWRSLINQRLGVIHDRFIEKVGGVPIGFVGFVASTHLVGTIQTTH